MNDIDLMRTKHIEQITSLLGSALFVQSTFDDDTKHNTDLIVLKTREGIHIACRVRETQYLKKYHGQFTIRSRSRYGNNTEYDKIMQGFGDYMFYGFEMQCPTTVNPYGTYVGYAVVLDLDVFRREHIKPSRVIPNSDGTGFYAFDIQEFSHDLIVANFPSEKYWFAKKLLPAPMQWLNTQQTILSTGERIKRHTGKLNEYITYLEESNNELLTRVDELEKDNALLQRYVAELSQKQTKQHRTHKNVTHLQNLLSLPN